MADVADDAADQLRRPRGHVGDRAEQAERHDDLRSGQGAGGRGGDRALVGQHLGVALVGVLGLAVQGVPLVVQAHDLGPEVDVEGLLGLAAGVEPAQDRRLEDAQRVGGGGHPAGGRRHLLHAGEAHEGVGDVGGGAEVEDPLHDLLADGVGRAGRGVVEPAGLEVDALVGPAHGPVDLPDQLALGLGRHVGDVGVAAGAGVGEVRGLVVVRRDLDGVAAAAAAVGLVGEPRQRAGAGGGVVLVCHGVGQRGRLLLGLRGGLGLLGAVLGQHLLDHVAVTDRVEDLLGVGAGEVLLGLGHLDHLDAELDERRTQRCLEVLGPGVVALPRVGYGGERAPDVLGPARVDPGRHLAEAVEVVPAVQVAHRHAPAAQLLGHEVRGQELAQVAQVDRPRRARTGRTGDDASLGQAVREGLLAAGVADRVVRRAGHPVDRLGALAAGSGGTAS